MDGTVLLLFADVAADTDDDVLPFVEITVADDETSFGEYILLLYRDR